MRQNQFSKLKKAIRDNDKLNMIRAMMGLPVLTNHPARARRAVTRGKYIQNEVNRALRNLKRDGNWTQQLKDAFEIVRARAGEEIWNEVIWKAPEPKTEVAATTEAAPTT